MSRYGVKLGYTTAEQRKQGVRISLAEAKPGDLIFFDTYKVDGHVGIYLGNGKFIGAQSSKGVSIEDLNNPYWRRVFHGHVRRVANFGTFGPMSGFSTNQPVNPAAYGYQMRGSALREVPNSTIRGYIDNASRTYGIRPELIAAVMKTESGFRNLGTNYAGAVGLMQVLPKYFGQGAYNPAENVMIGTRELKTHLARFGDVRLALAAYNAGPSRVASLLKKYGNSYEQIVRYLPKETQNYVPKVLSYL